MAHPVTTITLLYRRPGLSHEEFLIHWQQVHGPLARALPGLLDYRQRDVYGEVPHPQATPDDRSVPDGIAELTFASWDHRATAYASAAGRDLLADGQHFVGRSRTFSVGPDLRPVR